MKTPLVLAYLFLSALLLAPDLAFADTDVSSPISESVVWTKENSPYRISGRVTVGASAILSIEPGVLVIFADNAKLEILRGRLLAIGTVAEPIVFTGSATSSSWTLDVIGSLTPPVFPLGSAAQASSSMIASHLHIENAYQGLYLQSAAAVLDAISVTGGEDGIYVSGGTLRLSNSVFSYQHGAPLSVDTAGAMVVASTSITDVSRREGITAYTGSHLDLSGVRIERLGRRSAIGVYSSSARIVDSTFRDGKSSGIEVYGTASSQGESDVVIRNSSITGFSDYFIYNGGSKMISAQENWWGSKAGPGGRTHGAVTISPWLMRPPGEAGDSSVLFIPGIQATRLLKDSNQLWEPNRNADVEKLYLDSAGNTLVSDIRTGTIIDSVNSAGVGPNVYKNFIGMLDSLVGQKKLFEWQPLPYDWRLAASAAAADAATITRLMQMASSSFTGKVSIIAHSNGGLVARHLLDRLAELGLHIIDKVIFVAVPQLGTPQAIAAVLHGDSLQFAGGLILKQSVGRRLAQYSPGALGLLPRQAYFDQLTPPSSMIRFSTSTDLISMNFFQSYGERIDAAPRLFDFLSATFDRRTPPAITDVDTPAVIPRSLLDSSVPNFTGNYPDIDMSTVAGWGLDTLSGIEYSAKQRCNPPPFFRPIFYLCDSRTTLRHAPVWTRLGDKTVVLGSATGLASSTPKQTYFLDLSAYNSGRFRVSRNHADILEVPQLRSLITSILHSPERSDEPVGTATLPEHISTSSPESAISLPKQIRLAIHSPVTIDLYDGEGNHTGLFDTASTSPFTLYEEAVPGSQYQHFGEAKHLSFTEPIATSTRTIHIRSTGAGLLDLDIEYLDGDSVLQKTTFFDIPITPFTLISAEVALPLDHFETLANAFSLQSSAATSSAATTTLKQLVPEQGFDPVDYLSSVRQVIREICMSQRLRLSVLARLDHYISLFEKGELPLAQAQLKEIVIISDPSEATDPSGRYSLDTPEERRAFVSAVEALLAHIGTLSGGR